MINASVLLFCWFILITFVNLYVECIQVIFRYIESTPTESSDGGTSVVYRTLERTFSLYTLKISSLGKPELRWLSQFIEC
jgi:hypothetical protein